MDNKKNKLLILISILAIFIIGFGCGYVLGREFGKTVSINGKDNEDKTDKIVSKEITDDKNDEQSENDDKEEITQEQSDNLDKEQPQQTSKKPQTQQPQQASKKPQTQQPQQASKKPQTQQPQQASKKPQTQQPQQASKKPQTQQPQQASKKPQTQQPQQASKKPQTQQPQQASKKPQTQQPQQVSKKPQTQKPQQASKKPQTQKPVVQAGSYYDTHGKLKVSNGKLVDKNNNQIQLKGVSTHGIAWFGEYVNKDAFKTIKSWGGNVIRLAMYTNEYNGYMAGGDRDALEKMIDDGVNYATQLGMYVIIDWHILSDGNPNTYKSDAIKFFDKMSAKYKNYGNVIYEICNEPNNVDWNSVKSYADDVIKAIRKNSKDAIIIVGTPTWSQDADIAIDNPVAQPKNIMYAIHFYAATHQQWNRDKVVSAINKGAPIFVSEFSICDASGNGAIDYNQASEWMNLINNNKLSYCMWSLCNKAETSALISSNCTKNSGWNDSELSDTGKWLKENLSN